MSPEYELSYTPKTISLNLITANDRMQGNFCSQASYLTFASKFMIKWETACLLKV